MEVANTALSVEPNTHDKIVEEVWRRFSTETETILNALGMTEEVIDRLMIVEDADQANSMGEMFNAEWQDVDVKVTLDSGCYDHVMDAEADAPDMRYRSHPAVGGVEASWQETVSAYPIRERFS